MMVRRGIVLLAVTGLVACDVPTETPRWEQTWVVPGTSVAISVADLLPPEMTVRADRSAFQATTTAVAMSESLGGMCPACAPLDGLVAPKPEFTATLRSTATLPSDLVAGQLAGGQLHAVLEHDLGFDPLRPGGDPSQRGHLVVEVSSNGAIVAKDSISGHDAAFPPGTPLIPSLPVAAVSATNVLHLEVRIWSPAGDLARISTSDTLGLRMAESVVEIASATVRATDLEVGPTSTPLDFGIEEDLIERVEAGAARVVITNPFDVAGTLTVRFDMDGTAVERTVVLEPGEFTQRIEYSGDELRTILGSPTVDLVTSGEAGSPSGTVTLAPAQEMGVDVRFELVIRVGGREGT